MPTHYDNEIYNAFRAKAVTHIEDLKIGETYYSNSYPEKFVVKEVISWAELERRQNASMKIKTAKFAKSTELRWIVYGDSVFDTISAHDRGATENPYNPWLIFAKEEDMIECRKNLEVSFESSDYSYGYSYDSSYNLCSLLSNFGKHYN